MHAIQPLQEDWALLTGIVCVLLVAAAIAELVAKVEPLCLHQYLEALGSGGVRKWVNYTNHVTQGPVLLHEVVYRWLQKSDAGARELRPARLYL